MKATTQTFDVSFPKALLKQVDAIVKGQFGDRSDFLRVAALQYLRREKEWELVFRENQKVGIQSQFGTAEEVIGKLTEDRRRSGRWFMGSQEK